MNRKPDLNDSSDASKLLNQFSDEKYEEIRKIWKESPRARPAQPVVHEQDIDAAFKNVNHRLEKVHENDNRSSYKYRRWLWPAAAAVIAMVVMAAWLLIPRRVHAPNGEVAQVTLPDGSQVMLNSGSSLKYNELYSYTNRELDLNGEAFFSVKHGDHPFIVRAHHAGVKVTGTKFNVRSWAGNASRSTEVSVVEGTVQFYRRDAKQAVNVTRGQASLLQPGMKHPTKPARADLSRLLGWRHNKLIFTNQSLSVIFEEMERRFDTHIRLKNADIGRQKLSGYYSNPKSAESILKDICRVKGLHYAKIAHGFRVFKDK